jgi:Enterobacterial TraT complement resistance protein
VFFLPPARGNTIYLETRNTSDNQAVTLQNLASQLTGKGYQVISDPAEARYILQANTVYCNTEKQMVTMETMVSGGYGGGMRGAISSFGGAIGSIGGTAGMVNPMIGMGAAGVSAVTGAVGGAIDSISGLFGSNQPSSTEEITYACVTDLQIKERQDTAGDSKDLGEPVVYQTRLVAGVHQKKLDINEATPLVREKLVNGVAGNF